jgi:eukaryotic-like serine/threonine-protein kinase
MTTPTPPTRASLSEALEAIRPVIVANGWTTDSKLMRVGELLRDEATTTVGLTSLPRLLADRNLINREQAAELDQITAHQALFPRYQLLRRIGAGGMGMVYLARQTDTGRQVAFKSINARLAQDDGFVVRFQRETTALLGIRHPHIAEVLESGEADGHVFFAMDYIDGPSLMQILRERRVLEEPVVLRIGIQIASGLHHVYATAGLIHRDLKPENILITGLEGDVLRAHLIDFGLVKTNREDERLTQTGMTIGTPLYMSPEQVRGEALDGRSDIYGLGATLYHLATGMTPFSGTSPGAIMSAHLTEPAPDPGRVVPSLTQATRDLIMMCMAKRPEDRFATGEALVAACKAAMASLAPGVETEQFKFLKRPLVLNRPPPPPRRVATPTDGEKHITTRIMAKAAANAASRPGSSTIIRPDRVAAGQDAEPARRPVAEQIVRAITPPVPPAQPPTTGRRATAADQVPASDPGPALEPIPDRVVASRVFKEDPDLHQGGIGVGPWVFLVLAAVGAGLVIWALT